MTVEHGTISCYTGKATLCRCDECRRAFAAYQRRRRARLRLAGLAPGDERHGTLGGYTNWGCRCVECLAAMRSYQRQLADGGG